MDIPIIRVIVFPLKEPRNLSHSYKVAKLSRKRRDMLDEKNTAFIFHGRKSFPCSKPQSVFSCGILFGQRAISAVSSVSLPLPYIAKQNSEGMAFNLPPPQVSLL